MNSQEHGRKRHARIHGCVAFLMCIFLFSFGLPPVFSKEEQVVPCFSIVTLQQGQSLETLAIKYHTTEKQILQDNPSVKTLKPGITLTIRENTVSDNTVNNGNRYITTANKASGNPTDISRGLNSTWHWPAYGPISSDYGWRGNEFHHGIDIAIPSGTEVTASRAGKVVKAEWIGVYGLTVLLDHGNGIETLYAHNQEVLVRVGQTIETGQKIALSGNTGKSTGPHLHFEIRLNGKTVNPNPNLPKMTMARQ